MGLGAALLRALHSAESDVPAKGFKTKQQWAQEWGFGYSHTSTLLQRLIQHGAMERKEYKVIINGLSRRIPYYREIKKK